MSKDPNIVELEHLAALLVSSCGSFIAALPNRPTAGANVHEALGLSTQLLVNAAERASDKLEEKRIRDQGEQ